MMREGVNEKDWMVMNSKSCVAQWEMFMEWVENRMKSMIYAIAYVIRSGLRALIIQRRCSAVLFFHSCGNFSFSGHSDSTSFFHRFACVSISRSKLRKSSLEAKLQMPPHAVFDRKSTGEVTWGLMGNRSKKSTSATEISSFIRRICKKELFFSNGEWLGNGTKSQ